LVFGKLYFRYVETFEAHSHSIQYQCYTFHMNREILYFRKDSSRNTTRKRSTRTTRIKAQRNITTLAESKPMEEDVSTHNEEKKLDNQRIIMDIESIHQIIRKSKLLYDLKWSNVIISNNLIIL